MINWLREKAEASIAAALGLMLLVCVLACGLLLMSWSMDDPSLNHAVSAAPHNWLGRWGAIVADLFMQSLGLGATAALTPPAVWGWLLLTQGRLGQISSRILLFLIGTAAASACIALLPVSKAWPLPTHLGGMMGDALLWLPFKILSESFAHKLLLGFGFGLIAATSLLFACSAGTRPMSVDAMPTKPARRLQKLVEESEEDDSEGEPGWVLICLGAALHGVYVLVNAVRRILFRRRIRAKKPAPRMWEEESVPSAPPPPRTIPAPGPQPDPEPGPTLSRVRPAMESLKPASKRALMPLERGDYALPSLLMLAEPKKTHTRISEESLEQNARALEGVFEDFGVRGEIINVRPGPVVTLYELEPAPGVKSSRVIGLADDIARSMSAVSARVAVVQGRNAIGVELPNQRRETVYLREMLGSQNFQNSPATLAIALGKTIGGEPVIADLAKMPHLLVAGTTGSGKSVAINTMVLSLLYRLEPRQCRLIMVDPKMLELSSYDGVPHLLTPVVTDPKKAVVALKWAVREMEDRYRKMSKLGVRNIDGFNERVKEALVRGEVITRSVQSGFDPETGELTYVQEEISLTELPYIVIVVDEMADLMMVAGKDIEGAIQRLAQMARAAGIHLIMATQRPSVDVITGTIKANFPTRISFQVTSKIDSRTILGEQGAEQLLGQGDMLYMAGGGRISRVHGPFVSDSEVETIVSYLKTQGVPEYVSSVTQEEGDTPEEASSNPSGVLTMDEEEAGDYYDRAVAIAVREKKVSVSYLQRRLSVGYNKAASLVERMEREGVVSAPNHQGKREVLLKGEDE